VIRICHLLLLACVVVLFAVSGVQAQTIDYDGVRITAMPDIEPKSFFGYAFCRVIITNSSNRERDVRLSMRAQYSRALEDVSRGFKIAAGEVREESLMIPIIDFYASSMRVELDGTQLREQTLHRDFRCNRGYYHDKQILVDSRVSRTDFDAAFSGTGAGSSLNVELNQFEGSLSQLYQNWLGYSQFHQLIFYASSINEMPESVRRAVFDYVRAGGSLLTIGAVTLPEDFTELAQTRQEQPYNLKVYEGGFGRVVESEPDLIKAMADGSGRVFPNYFCDMFASYEFRGDSPLRFAYEDTATLSTRWLMIIVYIFAFLIGPVNVFVLHRLGRKILVFFTVPVASVMCCLFIYGYYLVFESSTLLVRRQSLTLLDERNNRAVTLANYSLFSSSSRPEGLRFDNQTEIFTYGGASRQNSDGGLFIVLDEDQHLTTGWIKPKVPRTLHLRALQTRRERVGLSWQNGSLQLLNGLGSDIESITLIAQDGRIYTGKNIAAGRQADLMAASRSVSGSPRNLSVVFNRPWFNEISDLARSPERFLKPGRYVAKIKTSPFLVQAIDSSAEKTEDSYVIGILKGDTQP
jgi:hypothetical protein